MEESKKRKSLELHSIAAARSAQSTFPLNKQAIPPSKLCEAEQYKFDYENIFGGTGRNWIVVSSNRR